MSFLIEKKTLRQAAKVFCSAKRSAPIKTKILSFLKEIIENTLNALNKALEWNLEKTKRNLARVLNPS